MRIGTFVRSMVTALLFAAAGWAQESVLGTIASFSGSEVGDRATYIPDRGSIRCLGMNNPPPTDGKTPPWCPNGTSTSARGRIFLMQWQTNDPNTSGTIRYNISFDVESSTWRGPWWGNFVVEVPDKGAWVGWLVGETDGRPAAGGKSVFRMFAVGEGQFAQCHLMAEVVYAQGKNTVTGRYLVPNRTNVSSSAVTVIPEGVAGPRAESQPPHFALVH